MCMYVYNIYREPSEKVHSDKGHNRKHLHVFLAPNDEFPIILVYILLTSKKRTPPPLLRTKLTVLHIEAPLYRGTRKLSTYIHWETHSLAARELPLKWGYPSHNEELF